MLLTAPEAVNTTAPGATGNINSITGVFSVSYISYLFVFMFHHILTPRFA